MSIKSGRSSHPIEAHGVIGDQDTTALVADDGTVAFLCWPHFDSPTVFAALLDGEHGGSWTVAPRLDGARHRQMYLPDTNVLVTRFLAPDGVGEIIDFMPFPEPEGGPCLVRRVRAIRGELRFDLRCAPRMDYARTPPRAEVAKDGSVILRAAGEEAPVLRLAGSVPLEVENGPHGGAAVAAFTLRAGEGADFMLLDAAAPLPDLARTDGMFEACVAHWRGWAQRCTYRGRWRAEVLRSALVLKLLTSREHGSILAAATFGLPEAPGGPRNWDYRATWIRDASFTVTAFMALGYREEALAFRQWIGARAQAGAADGSLQVMYGFDGRADFEEVELPHLRGYDGAVPVRIGNGARTQLQLDIYGELIDAVYHVHACGESVTHDGWGHLKHRVAYVCAHWRDPDQGIWEMRGPARPWLHSRVMCWVALDRAVKLARERSLPAPLAQWLEVRDAIYASVWEEFWDADRGHFTAAAGGTSLDGAMLMLPLVGFVSASDPRWLATLEAIGRELMDDPLVDRYREADGLAGREGAFTACSFLYAACLARAGRLRDARLLFEKMLGFASPLGLYSEEIGPSGEHLGNTPQALTHLALILAAGDLTAALDSAGGAI